MVLLGYWPYNESSGDAIDYSGHNNDGTVNSATHGVSGIMGHNAIDFDGSNDYINFGNLSMFDRPLTTNEITISVWVYPDGNQVDTRGTVLTKEGIYYCQVFDTGEISVYTYNEGGASSSYVTTSEQLTFNEWSHIVFTEDASQTRKVYIDGELSIQSTLGDGIGESTSNQLTSGNQTDNRHFSGKIAEVRLYDHALTGPEVSYLANVPTSANATTINKTNL